MFKDFDFELLNDPQFKEDSVREELISPLLKMFGYSASGPNKIIRSKALTHPFVHIGTKKYEVKIVPDYLLRVDNDHCWVLDAKGPREDIRTGKNVEQAFSYAIHPEVRAFIYALCNGRELAIYSVRRFEPLLVVKIDQLESQFEAVKRLLSPMAFTRPDMLDYKPDFGLYLLKLGWSEGTIQHFIPIGLPFIAKVEDGLFSAVVGMEFGGKWYCISFDFDEIRYQQLLDAINPELAGEIRNALRRQPYKIFLGDRTPELRVTAQISGAVHSNDAEDYCPLIVSEFKAL